MPIVTFFYAVNRSTHSKNSAGNGLKNLNHELGVLFFPTVNERTNSRGFAGLMIKCIVEKIANATITVARNINKRARLCLLESGRLALSSKRKMTARSGCSQPSTLRHTSTIFECRSNYRWNLSCQNCYWGRRIYMEVIIIYVAEMAG